MLMLMPLGAGKRSAGGFDRVRGCEIGKKDIQLQHVSFPLLFPASAARFA
jgi:hypothetical protein